MAAPTFVAEYESAWNTNADKTVAVTTAIGDVLVALCVSSNWADSSDDITAPTGGTGLTWTTQETIFLDDYTAVAVFTTTASAVNTGASITVSLSGAVDALLGVNILRFSGSTGIGAAEKTNAVSGAPSLNITTTQANSALCVVNGDWDAVDGTTRTWRTVNSITPTAGNGLEKTYFRDAAQYTVYAALYNDAGTVAAKTVGLSAPGAQRYAIAVVEVLGTSAGDQGITATGIASAEAFGTAVVSATNTISPTGIASAETFGTAVVSATNTINPTGIASAEAFGTATVSTTNTISPSGIASAEAFGTAVISTTNTIAPGGIASAEAFGTAIISAANTIAPDGIASAEAFGTAVISTTNTIAPGGIASAEAFGDAVVALQGTQIVAPSSIASAEAFGAATITPGAVDIAPTSIGSAEAFGAATISAGSSIAPAGIASAEAFGIPVLSAGPVDIAPVGIGSAEAFGTPTVTDSSQGQIISPTGIPSGERFGRAVVWNHIVRACDCSVLVDD